jgi:hypothetical protein
MCLFGRSQRGMLVTVTPHGLLNSPPMAFATQLMRGSYFQVRLADGGTRQGTDTLAWLYTIIQAMSSILE